MLRYGRAASVRGRRRRQLGRNRALAGELLRAEQGASPRIGLTSRVENRDLQQSAIEILIGPDGNTTGERRSFGGAIVGEQPARLGIRNGDDRVRHAFAFSRGGGFAKQAFGVRILLLISRP